MKGLTFLGSEYTYLLLLPLVYWCVDEKKGFRLGLAVILSTWLNAALKAVFKQPRPFHLEPSIGIISERNFGLPSGHAQMSLTLWGIIASWGRRKWLYGIAALISLLVGLSRLYLGVHFHTDLLAGWFLGGLVLTVYFLAALRIETLLILGGLRVQLIAAAITALLMNALLPGETTLGAVLLGMGGGYALMRRYAGFSASGTGKRGPRRVLILGGRYLIGSAGVMLLYLGLRPLIPQSGSAYFKLISFCRFIALQLWIYTGAPWVFLRLGLAQRREGFSANL
jgi:hypothetical protein